MRSLWLICAVISIGCGELSNLRDAYEGITERFVVSAVYVGVEDREDVDLTEIGLSTQVTSYLSDAAEISEVNNGSLSGLDVQLTTGSFGQSSFVDVGDGQYELDAFDGLAYTPAESAIIEAVYQGTKRSISVKTPVTADVDVYPIVEVGDPVIVDLNGQGFDAMLVVLIDVESASVVYSNEPSDVVGLIEMTHPYGYHLSSHDESGLDMVVEVPGEAIDRAGTYLLGVAGLNLSDPASYQDINILLSSFMAGRFTFVRLCTPQWESACE